MVEAIILYFKQIYLQISQSRKKAAILVVKKLGAWVVMSFLFLNTAILHNTGVICVVSLVISIYVAQQSFLMKK